jgi:hypothetical protein
MNLLALLVRIRRKLYRKSRHTVLVLLERLSAEPPILEIVRPDGH